MHDVCRTWAPPAACQGFISPAELYIFFKEIHHMWVHVMNEYADLAIYDVVDEIIDMVKAKDPTQIMPEDLAASGRSGIFFSMLSDVTQFYGGTGVERAQEGHVGCACYTHPSPLLRRAGVDSRYTYAMHICMVA